MLSMIFRVTGMIFFALFLLLLLDSWLLRPSDDFCSEREISWSPVRGLGRSWKMFPQITLFTKSEFFGTPIQKADNSWNEALPSEALPWSQYFVVANISI